MEAELYEAAMKGNVRSLLELLGRDELLLDRIMTGNQTETPLHIAAMLGHLDFVDQILARKPELARDKDFQSSTPLHLAAAKGYFDIVASLLSVDPEVCFVRDKYERNPLHVAAMKGHVDVLEHLVQARLDAARDVVEHGQTILHLCVKHNRLEALKLLIDILGDDQFINSTDENGDSILHLAAADRQTKTIDFLISKGVSPTIKNSRGFTALGLLAQCGSVERAIEIKNYAPRTLENHHLCGQRVYTNHGREYERDIHPPVGREYERGKRVETLNSMQKTLLVVATLLATMAYQASITPPGGLWQDNSKDKNDNGTAKAYNAGESIMAYYHPLSYRVFIVCNTISLVSSLSVIILFLSGLNLKRRRITTWIALLTIWVAITFMAATYAISVAVLTPFSETTVGKILSYGMFAWAGLMDLIILFHFIRLIIKLVRLVLRYLLGVLKLNFAS